MLDRSLALRLRLGPWAASGEDSSVGLVVFHRERERINAGARALFFKRRGWRNATIILSTSRPRSHAECLISGVQHVMTKSKDGKADENGPRQAMLGPTSADAAGEDFTDARGRRWIVVGKVVPKEIDVAETEKERRNADDYPPPGPDPRTLSREDLAEKLRPRRLVGDYEYRLEQPDYEIAERILAMREVPNTEGSPRSASAFAKLKFIVTPEFIIGPDDRRRLDNPRFLPGSAYAYLHRPARLR